jgi:hypothetical protein
MIHIRQCPVPRSRTPTGLAWGAVTEIDGKSYSAVSRHGAPQSLARALVAAGIPDQPVEVRSEVCVFDNGAEIRTEELRGCISYRSLHTMAKTTFAESATAPLRRVRFEEQPEGLFVRSGDGENAFHRPPDDIVVIPEHAPPFLERRRCVSCDSDFVPVRRDQRFCRGACRLRAHRAATRADQAGQGVQSASNAEIS